MNSSEFPEQLQIIGKRLSKIETTSKKTQHENKNHVLPDVVYTTITLLAGNHVTYW